jgi:hypothetical protein
MKRFSLVLVVFACMLLTTPAAFAANREATDSVAGAARGYAYAGYSSIKAGLSHGSGSIVTGPLAEVAVSCSLSSKTNTQSIANASQGTFVSAGSAQDVITTTYSASSISSQASSTIHSLNMLAGLISARLISVVANSTGTTSSATSSNGTSFSACFRKHRRDS